MSLIYLELISALLPILTIWTWHQSFNLFCHVLTQYENKCLYNFWNTNILSTVSLIFKFLKMFFFVLPFLHIAKAVWSKLSENILNLYHFNGYVLTFVPDWTADSRPLKLIIKKNINKYFWICKSVVTRSICLSICPAVHLSISLFVCLSVHRSFLSSETRQSFCFSLNVS